MNGWAISVLLALVTAAGLIVMARGQRGVASLIAAAMLVGLAGYAWQGSPALPGRPTPANAHKRGGDTLFAHERTIWLETVGPDAQQLDGADALIHNGSPDYAAGILRAGVMRDPHDMVLWLGLGNALQAHADGMVTPAALYAFQRAAAVAPGHPAPPYFLGLAYVQMGDLAGADAVWRGLLAGAPADAPWRARVADRLALIERFRTTP
ncbi:tetratricopeptide repeat protein [Sphingomonas crusticola]|uniref:tetratricopeptide repeat protein n=1 Tax=Sphingomonas crusticola TaxID=1697973 RepID=UPI000E2319DE|nr:cytochrome C biogenesis protein [Sphingomonas crusticola]